MNNYKDKAYLVFSYINLEKYIEEHKNDPEFQPTEEEKALEKEREEREKRIEKAKRELAKRKK